MLESKKKYLDVNVREYSDEKLAEFAPKTWKEFDDFKQAWERSCLDDLGCFKMEYAEISAALKDVGFLLLHLNSDSQNLGYFEPELSMLLDELILAICKEVYISAMRTGRLHGSEELVLYGLSSGSNVLQLYLGLIEDALRTNGDGSQKPEYYGVEFCEILLMLSEKHSLFALLKLLDEHFCYLYRSNLIHESRKRVFLQLLVEVGKEIIVCSETDEVFASMPFDWQVDLVISKQKVLN